MAKIYSPFQTKMAGALLRIYLYNLDKRLTLPTPSLPLGKRMCA